MVCPQIFRRGSEKVSDLSWENLKKEVTVAVESEVMFAFPTIPFFCQEGSPLSLTASSLRQTSKILSCPHLPRLVLSPVLP